MTDIVQKPLHGVAIYNPDLLSKEELIAQFVARRELLDGLVEDLARQGSSQHHLLVGQRGMGKTSLLRRLGYAIEDDPRLSSRWLPLTFPEEQYNVSRLSDLYTNCIDALCDYLEQRGGQHRASELDDQVAALPVQDEQRAKKALSILLDQADELAKGVVLLIDNIDLVLDRIKEVEQWALRELISREKRLLLIGASATAMEITYKYQAPFYEFFHVHELMGLSLVETREVMIRLAELGKTPQVRHTIDNEPERLRTAHVLSGGNPRTVALLYNVLAQDTGGSVRTDLERLLDQCTALYKARFEEFPAQAQQIVDALAVKWDPCTAKDIADHTRLDVKAVSSQLNRLVKQGVVEKVAYPAASKQDFQIAERFFNIWYLMRTSRRVRRRMIWLVEFLKLFFGPSRIELEAREYLRAPAVPDSRMQMHRSEYGLALAQITDDVSLRDALHHKVFHLSLENRSVWRSLRRFLDLKAADADLEPIVDRQEKLADIRDIVGSAEVSLSDWDPRRFQFLLLGWPYVSLENKARLAREILSHQERYLAPARRFLEWIYKGWVVMAGSAEAAEHLYQAFCNGYASGMQDVDGLRTAAKALGEPDLAMFAVPDGEQASATWTKEMEDTRSPWPWFSRGSIALEAGSPDEGRAYLERALELAPDVWLGRLVLALLSLNKQEHSEALAVLDDGSIDSMTGKIASSLLRIAIFLKIKDKDGIVSERDRIQRMCQGGLLAQLVEQFLLLEEQGIFQASSKEEEQHILRNWWPGVVGILPAIPWPQWLQRILEVTDFMLLLVSNIQQEGKERGSALDGVQAMRMMSHAIGEAAHRVSASTQELEELFGISVNDWFARLRGTLSEYAQRSRASQETAFEWLRTALLVHELTGDFSRAEIAYRRALSLDPENPATLVCLGGLLASDPERRGEALAMYERALAIEPTTRSVWVHKAELLTDLGRHRDAVAAYDKAIEEKSSEAEPWGKKAELLAVELGQHEEALRAYEKALELKPENVDYLMGKGHVLTAHLQRHEEALLAYEKVIELTARDGGESADAWFHKGWTLRNLDRIQGAEDAFRTAIERDAEHELAWLYLVLCIVRDRARLDEAIAVCRRTVELMSDSAAAWHILARFLAEQGTADEEAEDAARRAHSLEPDALDTTHLLATILVRRGKWPEAAPLARNVLSSEDSEFFETHWPSIIDFFYEAVQSGRTPEAAALLAEVGMAEKWRPLAEALRAIAEGMPERLQRVAPEIRQPAEQLIEDLTADREARRAD